MSVAAAEAALARGDLIAGHDAAASALDADDPDPRLPFLRVLALARMGDTATALALYERYGLGDSDDVDTLALHGRLLKDAARMAVPEEAALLYAASSTAYRRAARGEADTFPLINAASTALLAGDRAAAEQLARRALDAPYDAQRYFPLVTRAEALLLLGRLDEATALADAAGGLADADDGSRASTLRQFRLLAAALAIPDERAARLVAGLRPAPTIVWSGHMFRADPAAEARLSKAIDDLLDRNHVRAGFGALACGADILVAEALLRRGGALNVVLPFDPETFVAHSVDPGGGGWRARFDTCLATAQSVDTASRATFVGDDRQFTYGSMMAMGLARARARQLGGEALQLAIWDGAPVAGAAGTAVDVALWRDAGGQSEIVHPGAIDRRLDRPAALVPPAFERDFRAILFADFVGFSKLGEDALPAFWRDVMGRAGEVLAAHAAQIESANSWGDAVFAIVDGAEAAARIALALRDATGGAMRIGVHYGPLYLADDPVTARRNAFGTEVTRAARVEPIVPTGEVYVTQQLAAMLALAAPDAFATHYVGQVPLAKGYGSFKMFRLATHG